jgi:hypothetical protein
MNETSVEWNNLTDLQQYIDLLGNVRDLLITNRKIKHQEITRLINEATPHLELIEKNTKKHALKFNVFSALGITRKEVIQSRFLAYLLDPNEDHSQGSLFLKAFLDKIDFQVSDLSDFKSIRVATELSAGENLGRMDIVIDCKPGDWLIVIENKVDAEEQKDQIPRYDEWLHKQSNKKKLLIFLTLDRHEAETGRGIKYLSLSYPDIAEAFSSLKIKAALVRVVITQYISICKTLGGINMDQDKDLIKLLSEPNNIKFTLEIEQQSKLIRAQVIQEFGEKISNILQKNLKSLELSNKWEAKSCFYLDKYTLDIDIRTKNHNTKSNYRMLAQHLFSDRNWGFAGWSRPEWIDKKELLSEKLETNALSEKMKNDGNSGAESSWVGFKYLREGKKGFSPADIDDIIACYTDNQSTDHRLANTIANELWWMFENYHADIEALESFKQAAS